MTAKAKKTNGDTIKNTEANSKSSGNRTQAIQLKGKANGLRAESWNMKTIDRVMADATTRRCETLAPWELGVSSNGERGCQR